MSELQLLINDAIVLSDSKSESTTEGLAINDTLSLIEGNTFHNGMQYLTINDTVGLTDSRDSGNIYAKSISDTLTLADAITKMETKGTYDINETLGLSDSVLLEERSFYLVYNPVIDSWTNFHLTDGKIKQGITVSAGDSEENVNLLLQQVNNTVNVIKYYPTTTTDSDMFSQIITKDFYVEKGVIRRVSLSHDGDADVETKVTDTKLGVDNIKEHIIRDIESDKWRGIANAKSRGKQFCVVVYDADVIKFLGIDYKVRILE